MALKQVTAPATEPLALADVKAHLKVDNTADDSYITALIVAARQYVETYLGRSLISQTWRYTLDAFPCEGFSLHWNYIEGQAVQLPRPPLVSVTSITYLDYSNVVQTLSPSVYQVDTDSEPGRVIPTWGHFFPLTLPALNAVSITYAAGYGDSTTIPQGIKQAMYLIIGNWYEHRESVSDKAMTKVPMAAEHLLWSFKYGDYQN